jgi:hypothetical protein
VSKGYTQNKEDFFDTYSPLPRLATICILLWNFPQWRAKRKFYMTHPDGFVVKGHKEKVFKLYKSLYGLKQASNQWHDKFDLALISASFSVDEVDQCVY